MSSSVLALDIGYGHTKVAFRNSAGGISTDKFPSLAPYPSDNRISDVFGTSFGVSDLTTVKVDGVRYEVGPGVTTTAAFGQTGRDLTEDFVLSRGYAALLAGAVYRSGLKTIHRLVLGLPVHTMNKHRNELKERFTGTHDYGLGPFTIEKVNVIPQPIGTLSFATEKIAEGSRQSLVIDVGYYSVDWVFTTDFKIDDRRSGGRPGGMSAILKRVASAVRQEHGAGDAVYDLGRIDECLRTNEPFDYFGHKVDLRPLLPEAHSTVKDVMLDVKAGVGQLEGVTTILLSGGGAEFYAPIVRETFPRTRIEIVERAQFANAIGFLLVGESANRMTN